METFEALPLDSQHRLLSLLPIYDQTAPPDVIDGPTSSSSGCWIHPTALKNEFLSKALQDYSSRQMKGEFTPRFNSRAGLRKSVGNRQRYSTAASPAASFPLIRHMPTIPPPPLSTPISNLKTKDETNTPDPSIVSNAFLFDRLLLTRCHLALSVKPN